MINHLNNDLILFFLVYFNNLFNLLNFRLSLTKNAQKIKIIIINQINKQINHRINATTYSAKIRLYFFDQAHKCKKFVFIFM